MLKGHRKVSLENFLLQAEPPQPNKCYRWALSCGLWAVRRRRALLHEGRCQDCAVQGMVSGWKSMKKSHALSACHSGSLFMCPSFSCQCITASMPFQEGLFPIMWTEGTCCQFSHFLCQGRWMLWLLCSSGNSHICGYFLLWMESDCSLVSLSFPCVLSPWLIVALKGP